MRAQQSAPLAGMLRQSIPVLVFGAVLSAAIGCKSKGPVPGGESPSLQAPNVATTETSGAHPGAANPRNPHGDGDPHASLSTNGPDAARAPAIDRSGMLSVGAIAFEVPKGWTVQAPTSSMRRAQLSAEGGSGTAELVVYYFGPQGAGSTEDNVERWIGQFSNADGSPVTKASVETISVAGQDATRVDVSGRYTNTMMGGGQGSAPRPDQRLVATIFPSAEGPYYFKFLGPKDTVGAQAGAFDGLIQSIRPTR